MHYRDPEITFLKNTFLYSGGNLWNNLPTEFKTIANIDTFKRRFNTFPNPHLRTSSFLINGQVFFDYVKNIKIQSKEDTWEIESGKKGLTNYFKNKNYDIYVINSDGKKFTENEWIYSETYCYSKQSKSIISDKHTRKYLDLPEKEQILTQLKAWGK